MKYLFTFFLVIILSISCATAQQFDVAGIQYNITRTTSPYTVEVLSNSYSGKIVIPETVAYSGKIYTVNTISNGAFYFESLTEISLPKTLKSIGESAFRGCYRLKNIILPINIKSIPVNAFADCDSLTTVSFPNGLTSIGDGAFQGCNALNSLNLPISLTSIGSMAYYGCFSITSITLPNSVTVINTNAFSSCTGLKEINLSTSLTSLSNYVFDGCNALTKLTLPASITSIGSGAFKNCSGLQSINSLATKAPIIKYESAPENQPFYGINKFIPIEVPESANSTYKLAEGWKDFENTYASNSVFEVDSLRYGISSSTVPLKVDLICGKTNYKGNINVPSTVTFNGNTYAVTKLGGGVFYNCGELLSVNLPNSLLSIGNAGFRNSRALLSISSQSDLLSIGNYCFRDCIKLKTFTLGNKLKSIGIEAFAGCSSLEFTEIPLTVDSLGAKAFSGCFRLRSITIPDPIKKIGDEMFSYCDKLVSVKFSNKVNSIGAYAFAGCSQLGSINLPDSLNTIGDYAFSDCTNLRSIVIPSLVSGIGNSAFKHCTNLGSITSNPLTVPILGTSVFNYVSKSIPLYVAGSSISTYSIATQWNEFTNIIDKTSVFENDGKRYHVTSAISPYSVELVANSTPFNGNVIIPVQVINDGKTYAVTGIYNAIFARNTSLTSINLPNSIKKIENGMFDGCTSITTVTLGNAIDTIGVCAFYNCPALKTITLPASVKSIGTLSFAYCAALTTLTIGESVDSIGDYAFKYCSKLTSATLPNSVKVIGKGAFTYCDQLKTVNFGNSVEEVSSNSFRGCPLLTTAQLPSSLKKIGSFAFYECSSLVTVNIPNQVTRIEESTFTRCSKMTSVQLGQKLNYIGYGAFSECSGLTSVTIPALVDTIGDYAFNSYRGGIRTLTSLAIIPPTIKSNSFNYTYSVDSWTTKSVNIFVPLAALNTYKTDKLWSKYINIQAATMVEGINYRITSTKAPYTAEINTFSPSNAGDIVIPSTVTFNYITYNVTGVADNAFNGYSDITSITLPNTVKYIGTYAFYNCSKLATINLPDSLNRVGASAFYNTPIDNTQSDVKYIGKILIGTNKGLFSAPFSSDIKEGTVLIADGAFSSCFGLQGIKIPNSVKYIGKNAFSYCSNLNSVVLGNSITEIGNRAFLGCGFDTITFPASLTNIKDSAFMGCAKLSSLKIPASVNYIGNQAFTDCELIKGITCDASIPPSLGSAVFKNVSKTIPLYVRAESVSSYKLANQWNDFTITTQIIIEQKQSNNRDSTSSYKIYPNPVRDSFSVSGLKEPSTVYIYDLNGRTLLEKPILPDGKISLSQLSSGVLNVQIVNATRKVKLKVLKVN